jgi:hypothetical protein
MTDRSYSLKRQIDDESHRAGGACVRPPPAWRHEAGARETPLCQRCAGIDFGKIIPRRRGTSTGAVKLGTASDIAVNPSCSLCLLFSHNYHQRQFCVDDQVYYLYPFYTSHIYAYRWIYGPGLQGIPKTISFTVVEGRDIQSMLSGNAWVMRDTIKGTGWISPIATSSTDSGFAGRELGQKVDFALIKGWLDFCTTNHRETCGIISSRVMLPIRVIDCASRTIMTAAPEWRYVALSYVWGKSPPMESEEVWCAIDGQVLPAPLPNVIEDAIIATQKLGFQYLWVDRYSINQLDTQHKKSQIQQMDLVYSRASCTLIAAAGSNPSVGLPGTSTTPRKPSFSVSTRHGSYVSVPPDPLLKIEDSVWNTRGWTFQEALLSRRRVVFCDDQVYFSCGGMACRDPMNLPLKAMHRKNLRRFSAWNEDWNDSFNDTSLENRLFMSVTVPRYPFHECSKLIRTYTHRSLSNPSDILNGFLGIFQRFRTVHQPFRQFYGVIVVPDATLEGWQDEQKRTLRKSSYTEQLATGLCWDVDRSMSLSRSGSRRDGFPSWSWTGWLERITTPNEYSGYISNTHDLRISVEDKNKAIVEWEQFCSSNPPGKDLDASAKLHVEATFVEVTFRHSATNPATMEKQHPKHLYWWAVIEKEDKTFFSARFSLTREEDKHLDRKLLTNKWQGFILGSRCGTYYAGSHGKRVHQSDRTNLVVMVVDESSGVAERLGMAIFSWDASLDGVLTTRRAIRWG